MVAQPAPDETEPEAFATDLLRLASRAQALGMADYAEVLDALSGGILARFGLDADAPIPFTVVD